MSDLRARLKRESEMCGDCNSGEVFCPLALAEEMLEEIDRLRAELENAESALIRNGFRKSCDIPACNCGDQWGHGGHANKRLSEIDEALPYENGKTILQRVTGLVVENDRLRAENEALRKTVDRLLAHCPNDECSTCGEIVCPGGEWLHFHHDGCPHCWSQDAAMRERK